LNDSANTSAEQDKGDEMEVTEHGPEVREKEVEATDEASAGGKYNR